MRKAISSTADTKRLITEVCVRPWESQPQGLNSKEAELPGANRHLHLGGLGNQGLADSLKWNCYRGRFSNRSAVLSMPKSTREELIALTDIDDEATLQTVFSMARKMP
jgi:hypothetical protein